MSTTSADELLEAAARGESIESEDWPHALDHILSRLEEILRTSFPIPTIPAPDPPPPPLFSESLSRPEEVISSQSSTSTNKENAPPRRRSSNTPTRPPVPSFAAAAPSSQNDTQATQADSDMQDTLDPIPQSLLDVHNSIRSTLKLSFSKHPPHTIQRLAELVLSPRTHYRFLPSYLHALDRVVCVSSPAHIFPLPTAVLPNATGLLNGTTSAPLTPNSASSSLGSDESLGGALLTPIPWLRGDRAGEGSEDSGARSQGSSQEHIQLQQQQQRERDQHGQNELKSEETEMVDGPNGFGRVETVSVVNGVMVTTSSPSGSPSPNTSPTAGKEPAGSQSQPQGANSGAPTVEESLREAGAVTQGELLRLEQEAGVVPVSVAARSPSRAKTATSAGQGSATASASYGTDTDGDAEIKDVESEQEDPERPHARGPEEIGAEDVGPQSPESLGPVDMARAVGRSASGSVPAEEEGDVEMKDSAEGGQSVSSTSEEAGEPTLEEGSKDEEITTE